jgi:hypothetical protein
MPKSASCAFRSDSESAHASIRSSVASQLPVSGNSKPLTGAQSPPLQIHSERIHRIVVRFRAEVGPHWVFARELCGPQESRGKATHLPRLSEIPPLVNSPGENLPARFLHSQFRFCVSLGELNLFHTKKLSPLVNGCAGSSTAHFLGRIPKKIRYFEGGLSSGPSFGENGGQAHWRRFLSLAAIFSPVTERARDWLTGSSDSGAAFEIGEFFRIGVRLARMGRCRRCRPL